MRVSMLSFDFFPPKEFEESGDPEKHFQALLSLAQEGIEKGKVWMITLTAKEEQSRSLG